MKKLLILCLAVSTVCAMQKPAARTIDRKKQNQLVEAARKGKVDEVGRLLRFKPQVNVNESSSETYETPIEAAVRARKHEIVEFLINNGADPDQKTYGGLTPGITLLMEAATNNDPAMVELLLDKGADKFVTFNDNQDRGGKDRTAIDFVIGTDATARKLRDLLTISKKKLL